MASSTPVRIDGELYDAARAIARSNDRSAAQQIAHWARLGRELETSRTISAGDIADVLAGRRGYDTLDSEEQAIVRVRWSERLDELAGGVDLARQFETRGRRTWVDIDPDGNVVHRELDPS